MYHMIVIHKYQEYFPKSLPPGRTHTSVWTLHLSAINPGSELKWQKVQITLTSSRKHCWCLKSTEPWLYLAQLWEWQNHRMDEVGKEQLLEVILVQNSHGFASAQSPKAGCPCVSTQHVLWMYSEQLLLSGLL